MKLTKTQFTNGLWEGLISDGPKDAPDLVLSMAGAPQEGLDVEPVDPDAGSWRVWARMPLAAIGDDAEPLVIHPAGSPEILAVLWPAPNLETNPDLHAEVTLLRAEIELLKRVLRRHISGTADD